MLAPFTACAALPSNLTTIADVLSQAKHDVFEAIYRDGRWMGGVDGAGCKSGWSAAASGQADSALALLTIVVQTHGIRSLLDLPIGDGCFSTTALRYIRQDQRRNHPGQPPLMYTGIDIVSSLIAQHQRYLADAFTQFVTADATMLTALPRTDLIFSRMMMQHMCNHDVLKVLRLIDRSGARFALMTTFRGVATYVVRRPQPWMPDSLPLVMQQPFSNADIPCLSGGYRAQDLTLPPFSLPPPRVWWSEAYPKVSLYCTCALALILTSC